MKTKRIEFNPDLFKEVVQVNTRRIAQSIINASETYAALKGNPIMTEDEVREEAVRFFQKQLAKELYEYLPR